MAALKTVLIHLNDPRRAKRLIQSALAIAIPNEAHVIALMIAPPLIEIGRIGA